MRFIDLAPFVAVFLTGLIVGQFLQGRWSWVCLALPLVHLLISILSGRAGEDLFSYVIPVNAILVALTIAGMIVGRARRRTVGQRRRRQVEAHDQDPVGPG